MPVTMNEIEYLTTEEAMKLVDMSRTTWQKYAREYGLEHYTKPGKSKRFLWQKSDVERLLEPLPVKR